MWKKKEPELPPDPVPVQPTATPDPQVSRPVPSRRPDRAVIGPSIRIRGEIFGEEDLLVQGQIEGKLVVKNQGITVGKSGKVKADIHARSIRVEGLVRGDLFGEKEVIIEASGDVEGNLVSPSVRLENGSRFKGSIDMEQARQPAPPAPQVGPSTKPPAVRSGPNTAAGSTSETETKKPEQQPLRP